MAKNRQNRPIWTQMAPEYSGLYHYLLHTIIMFNKSEFWCPLERGIRFLMWVFNLSRLTSWYQVHIIIKCNGGSIIQFKNDQYWYALSIILTKCGVFTFADTTLFALSTFCTKCKSIFSGDPPPRTNCHRCPVPTACQAGGGHAVGPRHYVV